MNILFVEDQSISSHITEALEGAGHTVLKAPSISDANYYWTRRIHPLHAIVVDLRMPVRGLRVEDIMLAYGGKLAGWVWLEHSVLTYDDGTGNIRDRIIIYSEYLKALRKYIQPPDRYRRIALLAKGEGKSIGLLTGIIANLSRLKVKPISMKKP
jgi:CheY-like chemotaxis protein